MSSPHQIRRALDSILASSVFAGSERMCRFLRFVVERHLAGRAAELKEYTIGVEVFDRDPRYDPRVDPIVRVEARRLRSKLQAYYEGDGKHEAVLIRLPKGTYVPEFAGSAQQSGEQRPEPAGRSLAVLPFENASREPDADYLSDGLTQQIIHRLTRVHGIRVVGWNSAARMRERSDVYEAARELNASTLLVGSVRCGGGRLRITAQLADVASGAFLWSEFYDRPMQDLLLIEEEISRSIVEALQVQLGLAGAATGNPEAYELYFKGRYYWNKRTADGIRRGIALFRQALDVDPSFALAWAGVADGYLLLADYAIVLPSDVIELARRAAEQALRLSPCLGEAECSLAMIRCLHDWEWDDGERRFKRAMELNPGYATAFHWYAIDYCALRSMFDDASDALETALDLDPLSLIARENRGYLELLRRRYDRAIAEHKQLAEFEPSFHKVWTSMGRAYIQAGNYEKAIEALEKGASIAGGENPSMMGALGQAHAFRGDSERARQILARLLQLGEQGHVPASAFAAVYIGLGQYSSAIESLKRGCERRDMVMAAIGVHPLYDPLRHDPEFNALVARVGCLR